MMRRLGLALGPLAALAMLAFPPPAGLSAEGWRTAAIAVLMAVWWCTEALPLAATALLPLLAFPLLGVGSMVAAATPYANPLIFLFLGGFLLGLGMQRWGLHRRIALMVMTRAGARPRALVGALMAATAALSMWISNTATTMVMMPIAASLVATVVAGAANDAPRERDNFAAAAMLGVAYAASIGGLATLIGSPPNALLAGFMAQTYGVTVSFAAWMAIGLPVVALMLPLAWASLVWLTSPFRLAGDGREGLAVAGQYRALGPMLPPERRVAAIFAVVAVFWLIRPLVAGLPGLGGLTDEGIAVGGALLLFLVPSGMKDGGALIDWETAKRLRWDVLLLFGGGLSLAAAVDRTGLAAWIGGSLGGLSALPPLLLIAAVTTLVIFLTELTSNTATTASLLPVLGAAAVQLGQGPLMLAAPAALAASCAFMLPVATPPNAIVYGSGHVTIGRMIRAGIGLNLIGIVVITLAGVAVVPLLTR